MPDSDLDLVVAGTHDAVMMVESEAKELSEEVMLGAVMFGHRGFQPIIDMIIAMAEECAKEPWELQTEDHSELYGQIKAALEADLRSAYAEPSKQARQELIGAAKTKAAEQFAGDQGADEPLVMAQFKKLEKDIVRNGILDTKTRIDGRDTETVRPILAEVGVLPRVVAARFLAANLLAQ
jgi:polyribonucleotide nucleotidyltransferase